MFRIEIHGIEPIAASSLSDNIIEHLNQLKFKDFSILVFPTICVNSDRILSPFLRLVGTSNFRLEQLADALKVFEMEIEITPAVKIIAKEVVTEQKTS